MTRLMLLAALVRPALLDAHIDARVAVLARRVDALSRGLTAALEHGGVHPPAPPAAAAGGRRTRIEASGLRLVSGGGQ